MTESRYLRLIDALIRHDVRFVIVGGMAAVLQRAPVLTEDMDVVRDRAADNVDRLVLALAELDAVYRDDPRQLRPGISHLIGPGSQLLEANRLRWISEGGRCVCFPWRSSSRLSASSRERRTS